MRMNAYYYGFTPTGNHVIDRILSAVACAGKSYHNTDCWQDDCTRDGCEGKSPEEWIQNAANNAAVEVDLLWDRVVAKGEAHARAVRDYNRVCRQLEVDGKIHDATVERLTARVKDLEVELENAEQKADDWYKWYSERESEIERLTTELATAQALAGAPAPDAPTGTCSGEPPLTEKNRRNNG